MENMTIDQGQTFYNPNGLTVYKYIAPTGEVTYPYIKTVDLEGKLDSIERLQTKVNALQSQINRIIDNLTEDSWFNPNTETSEVLVELCDILGHEPKKTIEFTATMNFTGSIDINLADAESFDLEEILGEAYVEINNGDVVIDSYELYDANECQFLIGGYHKRPVTCR